MLIASKTPQWFLIILLPGELWNLCMVFSQNSEKNIYVAKCRANGVKMTMDNILMIIQCFNSLVTPQILHTTSDESQSQRINYYYLVLCFIYKIIHHSESHLNSIASISVSNEAQNIHPTLFSLDWLHLFNRMCLNVGTLVNMQQLKTHISNQAITWQ